MNKQNRTKSFMWNSLSTGIYQLVVMMLGFITPKIMLQIYGSEINGLVSSINQFISYFNLVEAGLAGVAVHALYKPLADNDYDEINSIVSATNKFYIQSGCIFLLLLLGLSIIYPLFVKLQYLSSVTIGMLVLVLGSKGLLEFFTLAKYRALLTADQKTYVISNASIIYVILNMIIILVLALKKVNIVLVYFIAIVALFARTFILIVYCKKNYKYLNYKVEFKKNALRQRWDACFFQISGSIMVGAPTILATIFTNLKMVSIYSIYNMVMTGINGVLSIFISGLSASFGDIIARKEIEILQKAYKEFEYIYLSLLVIVYSTPVIMIVPFVKLYTSNVCDINYERPLIGFLFVLESLLYNIKTPQGILIIAAGLYRETRSRYILQSSILIIFGVLLSPKYGLIGILISSCLANLYRCVDVLFFVPKYITRLSIKSSLLNWIRVIIMMIIIVVPIHLLNIKITNVLSWIINSIVIVIYGIIIVSIFSVLFNKKELKGLVNRIKLMIGGI